MTTEFEAHARYQAYLDGYDRTLETTPLLGFNEWLRIHGEDTKKDRIAISIQPKNYFQIKFKRTGAKEWDDSLRCTERITAQFVATQLQRTRAISMAYVVERKADGTWVRNW